MKQSPRATFDFAGRQSKLLKVLEQRRLAALLVTDPINIAYLSGFHGSAGVALLGPIRSILWVDPRYTLEAGEIAAGVAVLEAKKGLLAAAGRWLGSNQRGLLGIDDCNLTVRSFEELKKRTRGRVRFSAAAGIVEGLRAVKDELEIEKIRVAAHVTAKALAALSAQIRPGVSELEVVEEIEYRMRQLGAQGTAFESIVASGHRGALPHAHPSRKLLQECDLVIIDVGAIVDGYVADMTRTFYLGEPDARVQRLYGAVLEAQEQGITAVKNGARASAVDFATRRVLRRRGRLDRLFTHSTGHGLGLEVHERPRLGRGDKTVLRTGSVVTVEPGIYMQGFGGIRIEDTVLVGPTGPEVLTPASKTNWVVA